MRTGPGSAAVTGRPAPPAADSGGRHGTVCRPTVGPQEGEREAVPGVRRRIVRILPTVAVLGLDARRGATR